MSVNFQHKVNCHPFAFYLKTLLVDFIHCVMYRLKELNDIKGAKIEELRRQIDEEVGKEQMESWVSIMGRLSRGANLASRAELFKAGLR